MAQKEPDLTRWIAEGRYPPPAFLEGWFDLPDGLLTTNTTLAQDLGNMESVDYANLLAMAKAYRPDAKRNERNEISLPPLRPDAKRNERNEISLCLCGCERELDQPVTGRKKKYYSSACRSRHFRDTNKVG